jgi:hypothetical protein
MPPRKAKAAVITNDPVMTVIRNNYTSPLDIGGVVIPAGGCSVVPSWDHCKLRPVIAAWLSHGVIEVVNGVS